MAKTLSASRRLWLTVSCSVILTGASSGFTVARPARLQPITVPKLSWKGVITMYAGGYTPSLPSQKSQPGAKRLTELYTLAKQFEHMYPGIKIQFQTSVPSNSEWIITKATAGDMYDVYEQQYADFNLLPRGIVYNLNPYFNQPNPYIPGNKRWKDAMSQRVLEQTAAPNGDHYEVDGDWVSTAFYYNKNLFRKAGIINPPPSWNQLLADCRRLKAHGITPGADVPTAYSWWARLFLGNSLGAKTITRLEGYSGAKYTVSAVGEVAGYKTGILNPGTNPRIMAWWPVLKKLYSYWDPNVTDLPWDAVPPGSQIGRSLFAAGKVAMVYQASVIPNFVKGAGAKFPLGSFPFPASSLRQAYKYGTSINSSADVGGPSAAFQYGVSTPRADHTMRQPGKFQAVLDWLRFIGTPAHDQAIVNQLGNYVPTFVGTHPLKSEQGANIPKGALYASILGFSDLTAQSHVQLGNLFQEYLTGGISFSGAKREFNSIVAQAVQQYVAVNHPRIP